MRLIALSLSLLMMLCASKAQSNDSLALQLVDSKLKSLRGITLGKSKQSMITVPIDTNPEAEEEFETVYDIDSMFFEHDSSLLVGELDPDTSGWNLVHVDTFEWDYGEHIFYGHQDTHERRGSTEAALAFMYEQALGLQASDAIDVAVGMIYYDQQSMRGWICSDGSIFADDDIQGMRIVFTSVAMSYGRSEIVIGSIAPTWDKGCYHSTIYRYVHNGTEYFYTIPDKVNNPIVVTYSHFISYSPTQK